ncbi:MAG: methyl-accepting chemotaxis protein [Methylobacter sp.]|nr:methyl-accepting chemotaxis protein [Methylobacter sp.]
MNILNSLKLSHRFALLIAAFTIGFAIYGSWSFKILNDLKINGALYQRIVQGKDLVADILPPPEYIIESYLVTLQLINEADSMEQNKLIEQLKRLKDNYMVRHEYWHQQELDGELDKAFLEKSYTPAIDFYEAVFNSVIPAVQKRDREAVDLVLPRIKSDYETHRKAIDQVVEMTNQRNKFDENFAAERIHTSTILLLAVLILTLVAGTLISLLIIRSVFRQLGGDPDYAAEIVNKISQGDFTMEPVLKAGDKSSLIHDLRKVQKIISIFAAAQDAVAQKHSEGVISELLWADQFPGTFGHLAQLMNDQISSHVTVNKRVVEVITQYAKGNFSADMDRMSGENAQITEAIDNIKNALTGISNEIKMLGSAGARGDFSKRGDAARFEFIFKDILIDINTLFEICDTGFSDIERVTQALAKGDLTQTISRDYPGTFGAVMTGMNSTSENLKSLVSEIKLATDTINTAAKEIADGNNDLSHRTEEQAASLEQTAASMEQLTATVQANAQNATQANQLAQSAAGIAAKGGRVVGQVVITMNSINDSSRKIVDIISVIDSIAFQTNILALNAAVEAARAGEQGRGFAVVAGEVRNLAHRAAAAAGEIKSLIGDSVEKVEGGSKQVAQAGKTMEEIVNSIGKVTGIIADITSASAEQGSGIQQVNQAIGQMDDVTQQNAALVEQAAAAAESLEEQTENLSASVAKFTIDENTRSTSQTPAQAKKTKSGQSKMPASAKPLLQMTTSNDEWEEF